MNLSEKKILMIFIEPTPYILDLLEKGFFDWKNKLEIIFLFENLSQNWNLKSYSIPFEIIKSKKKISYILYNIFLKRKYKLIHVAGWNKPFILFLILISRFFLLPVVVESDTHLNTNTPIFKKIIKRCFYPMLFKFPVFFLPGGTRQAKYLSYYGVKNEKMMNAQMTVDVTYITEYVNSIGVTERDKLRLEYGVQKNDLVFLFVGRLLEYKGLRELIFAIQSIKDMRAKLWIVGSGELADAIKLATQKFKQIFYLGRISGDLLWRIYHASDVFVMPSHDEPWGLVINEAMAAGLPIIVTQQVGCIDDLILEYHHGIIVQQKNVPALSEAMGYMLKNPEKRKLMGKNSTEKIATWTLKNEAKNIVASWTKSYF